MVKIKLATVYKRLNADRRIKLLQYIFRVQGAEMKRLDYSAAAKEFGVERAQIARDVRALEKAELVIVKNGELQLAADILEGD